MPINAIPPPSPGWTMNGASGPPGSSAHALELVALLLARPTASATATATGRLDQARHLDFSTLSSHQDVGPPVVAEDTVGETGHVNGVGGVQPHGRHPQSCLSETARDRFCPNRVDLRSLRRPCPTGKSSPVLTCRCCQVLPTLLLLSCCPPLRAAHCRRY